MPQGPPELHEEFGDDGAAMSVLEKAGFTFTRDFDIKAPDSHNWTEQEKRAVQYLCEEWDWGFGG